MLSTITIYTYIFLVGILAGSFLNVCIYRIPRHEEIVFTRSHCMGCGYVLKWYDLIPIFSWVFLRGRCRSCGAKISKQYPLVELANGTLWVITFALCGPYLATAISCLVISALLVMSVIDARTYEIPIGINIFILIVAAVNFALSWQDWKEYLIGFVSISGVLLILFVASGGRAIGGGDVKLMAAVGLLLGFKLTIIAFLFGCLYGSVIHIARMRISGEGHVLAMGPYLAMGTITAIWFGEDIANWYLSFFLI